MKLTNTYKLDLKTSLATRIAEELKARGLTQVAAAELIGADQPRISALVNLRLDKFSVDMLLDFAVALGIRIRVRL